MSPTTETPPQYSLSGASHPSIIRTGWKWIVIVTVLLMVCTFYSDKHSHKSYTSSASVVMGLQIFASGAEPLPPDMGTAKSVATSGVVIDKVAAELGLSSTQVKNDVSVTNPADTVVLDLSFTAPTPAQAQRGAEAMADAFVNYQDSSLTAVQKQLSEKESTGNSSSTLSVETAKVISPATVPTKPNGHSLLLDLLVALFAGICLGLGVALLVDRSSDRLRGLADVETLVENPVLAVIPELSRHETSRDPVCIIRDDPLLREAYRALRVRTEIGSSDVLGVTMLVTRPNEDVGPAVPTALGLAVSLALSGRKVVLVGADLHNCPLNKLFGTSGMAGLAEGLRNQTNWESALITTALPGLRLLTEGTETYGAQDLFGQQQLAHLFTALRRSFADVIVVDGPPLLEPEALMFVDAATLVVLDVDERRTTRTDMRAAMGRLVEAPERLVGAVLSSGSRGWRRSNWELDAGGLSRPGIVTRAVAAVQGMFGVRKNRAGARPRPAHAADRDLSVHWSDVQADVRHKQPRRDGTVLTQMDNWSTEDLSLPGRDADAPAGDGVGAVGSRSLTNREVI